MNKYISSNQIETKCKYGRKCARKSAQSNWSTKRSPVSLLQTNQRVYTKQSNKNTRLFLYTDHVDLLSIYIQNNIICLTEQYLRKGNSNKVTINKIQFTNQVNDL